MGEEEGDPRFGQSGEYVRYQSGKILRKGVVDGRKLLRGPMLLATSVETWWTAGDSNLV